MQTTETNTAAREKALQDVKMYMANDWELKEETPDYFLLKRTKIKTFHHVLIFMFTWYTLGIANYIIHKLTSEEKKILK